jgi:hypothetical protein
MYAVRTPHRIAADAHATSHSNCDNRSNRHSDGDSRAHDDGDASDAHGHCPMDPIPCRNEDDDDAYRFI